MSRVKRGSFCRTDNPTVWHVGASLVLHGALLDRGFELGIGYGGHGDEQVVGLLQNCQCPRPGDVWVSHLYDQVGAVVVEFGEVLQCKCRIDILEGSGNRIVNEANLDPVERVSVDEVVDSSTDQPVADQTNLHPQSRGYQGPNSVAVSSGRTAQQAEQNEEACDARMQIGAGDRPS